MTERQREIKWPDKKGHWDSCDVFILNDGSCNCGADTWNDAIDACRRSYDEAQVVGSLSPLGKFKERNSITEEYVDKKKSGYDNA